MNLNYFSLFNDVVINDIKVKNIYHRFDILLKDYSGDNFTNFYIPDKITIEDVALELYGNKEYYWIVTLFSGIKDFFYDWPVFSDELIDMLNSTWEEVKATGYYDETNPNYPGYPTASYDDVVSKKLYYDTLLADNEEKRFIKVLKPSLLHDFLYKVSILKI